MLRFHETIPASILIIVSAHLDAFCKRTERRRSGKQKARRFFWTRRANAITISEEHQNGRSELFRRDSGKILYNSGKWYLYYLDAGGRWRHYDVALPTENFADAFRHWKKDATGIFRSPRIRKSTEVEIERDALAVLVAM